METATKTKRTFRPIAHYWNLVKDIDRSQKLELATMLIDSVKPLVAASMHDTTEEEDFLVMKEEQLKPYTMEEINAMLDEAEANFAAGKGIPHDESMRRWREKVALKKQELEIAEAV